MTPIDAASTRRRRGVAGLRYSQLPVARLQESSGPHAALFAHPHAPVVVLQRRLAPHAVDAVQTHCPPEHTLPEAQFTDEEQAMLHECVVVEQRPGLQTPGVDSQRGWQKPCVPTERQ